MIAELMLARRRDKGREALEEVGALKEDPPRPALPHTLELIIEAPIAELLKTILSQRRALNVSTEPL